MVLTYWIMNDTQPPTEHTSQQKKRFKHFKLKRLNSCLGVSRCARQVSNAKAEHGKVAFSVGAGARRSTQCIVRERGAERARCSRHLPTRWVVPTHGVPVLAARRVWVGAAQHQWDVHVGAHVERLWDGSSDLLREILLWIFTRLLLLTVFSFFYFLRLSPCFTSCFTLAVTFPLRFSLFTSCLCLFPSSCVCTSTCFPPVPQCLRLIPFCGFPG